MNSITNLHQGQNKVIVSMGYDNITTNITLAPGHGVTLPVSTPYNLVWWNASDYLNPTDDPSVEVVKCIAKLGDTLIIMRSQQQTLASPKNIPGKLYNMALLPDTLHDSNLDTNLDMLSYYNIPQIHDKTKHDATTIDGGTALPIGQLPTHGIGAHTGTIGTWANIDKTTSSITDITTRSHTLLTDIGSNSHATIDETISNISKGTSWTLRTSAADNNWTGVIYGNGMFVAVARTGTGNRVMTSSDGITWTSRSSAADNNWTGVTYGNGLFVAVAESGTGNRVMTSSDGITWTSRSSVADNSWASVTYGNGLFVAVAYSGTGDRVMTSPDGIAWTIRTSAGDMSWDSVTYGNSIFVAVSFYSGGNYVMTSPDGITWTLRSAISNTNWFGITYGNGLFVAVAYTGTTTCVMTSPDGIAWTSRTGAASNMWYNITYGNGLFVAVAESGTGNRVMTSSDGITWTSRSSAADNNWHSITYGNGVFVAVARTGTGNRVMTSGKSELNIIPTNNIYQGGMSINGNVGIGTTNPTAKLHIGGTSGIDGIKFPDGTTQTTASSAGQVDVLAGIVGTLSGSWGTAPSPISEFTDDNNNYLAVAGSCHSANGSQIGYITWDLGSVRPLKNFDCGLKFYGSGNGGGANSSLSVAYSTNNVDWLGILTVGSSSGQSSNTVNVSPVMSIYDNVRYIRLQLYTSAPWNTDAWATVYGRRIRAYV